MPSRRATGAPKARAPTAFIATWAQPPCSNMEVNRPPHCPRARSAALKAMDRP